ncbi:MAG: membrane protein insertion efficiency factor YidD [Prevotellaceae bacterium]|jgi:putative component of membrane protein insertase Oxa1/YidC/SpoIIIJ protein YidD|nr:membrane protein insertion efficiency factor YidD [Prevotellaceae bacterium]
MPFLTEQDTVREYCRHRELYRPDTEVKTAVIWLLVAEVLGTAIAFFIDSLFEELEPFCRFSVRPPVWLSCSCGSLIACSVCLKKLLVTAIELYQRYAPETIRRRCILMPSCSEYAVLALYKYGVIAGLYRIYVRLTRTCRGGEYRIDYP